VKHYNPSISQRAQRVFNTKGEHLSDDVIPTIQPVIQVAPVARIVRNGNTSATGSLTPYTTPTDKDFYLTAIGLSYSKNVTCDVATGNVQLNITVDGASVAVIALAMQTLTAQDGTAYISFPIPIKVDRGTAITGTNSYTAGAMRRTGVVVGYTEEVTAS